jgi:hypothetical protein
MKASNPLPTWEVVDQAGEGLAGVVIASCDMPI